jgi:pilus assembly protein CpaD
MKKGMTMNKKLFVLGLGSLVAACNAPDNPSAGLSSIHVPVVSQTSYVFDMAAPGGMVGQDEAERLDKWFQSLELGYGDSIYVDGSDGAARGQVAAVAAQYGLLISEGAPVTQGQLEPGSVRVIVRRAEAHVPGCPDWSRPSQPDFNNNSMSNFGCGVNGSLAAQVADANDLVNGQAGASAQDGATASKAINMYRNWPLTGIIDGQTKRPLKKVESTARKED